jgi:hypothetical protein
MYLVFGMLWCFVTNVHAAVTGAPTALVAAAGPSTGMAKALDVALVVARQVAVWPLDIYEKVLRPIFS